MRLTKATSVTSRPSPSRGLAVAALLFALTPACALAQVGQRTPAAQHAGTTQPTGQQECNGAPCEDQKPQVIVVPSSTTPAPWMLHDRILWGAYLVLAVVGYAGVMVALSLLKKIERHTGAAVETAAAAAQMAHASLLHAQALVAAERPWVLVTAEPVPGVESAYEIKATNGGRSPARITEALDRTLFVADESKLPCPVVYDKPPTGERFVPIILLPGESSTLMKISREDARELCVTDDKFLLVESWKQKLFLCGRLSYSDLISPEGKEAHETNWCCWYIHGKLRSAVVPAGTAALNVHT